MDKAPHQFGETKISEVDRRRVLHGSALALVSLATGSLFGNRLQASPVSIDGENKDANETVTYLNAAELRRIVKSAPEEKAGHPGLYSVRLSDNTKYPVIGIRRTVATSSEVHSDFTDIYFVLEGTGTLVTGGTIVEGVENPVGEIRGKSIKDGNKRELRSGDFLVVPAGVPHWISEVQGKELLYVVVKMPRRE